MRYKFLPDIATADLAFEAFGKDYSELFENAGLALESAMVNFDSLEVKSSSSIKFSSKTPEKLLFDFLGELIYLKDAQETLFNKIECRVKKEDSKIWTLDCKLRGEKIDRKKHKLGVDVKAATKHLFSIEKLSDNTYRCLVILDI